MRIFKLSIALLSGMFLAFSPIAFAKVTGDTITLGSAISFTGKYSSNGIHASNGYNLGVKRVNEMGGVKVGGKTYKLEVKYYDDESTPARGAQLAERLIKQDGIKFFLGPYSSGLTKAIAPVTEKYKIPMVESEGASRSLFTQGYRYLFAVLSTSEQYLASAIGLAAVINKKNGKSPGDVKVAMAFESDPFSLDVRAGVMDDIKKHGLKVVVDDKLPRDLSDMTPTLRKAKALKADLLVVSGHSKGAATLGRQVVEMKVNIPMVAVTHCESAKLIKKFGAGVDGFLCPTQWAETLTYSGDGYKNVPYQAAQASAAVLVWAEAFERANSFDTEELRDALAATDMKTFYGSIRFSKAGNNIAKPMVLRQIQNGKLNVVAPPEWASHPVLWPR